MLVNFVVAYLNQTLRFSLRAIAKGLPKPKQLFLSYYTGKPVRRATLSKYLLKVMDMAGIDTECFKAHSIRGIAPFIMSRKGSSPGQIMEHGIGDKSVLFIDSITESPRTPQLVN